MILCDASRQGCRESAARRGSRIPLRVSILASGSSGNSTLLETEDTTLLIDAGIGKKEMLRRFEALGRQCPERVHALLITHEHSDHSSGMAQMARLWNCSAYLTEATHREILRMYPEGPIAKNAVHPIYSRGRTLSESVTLT